jgi:hypothetical protein
MKTQGGEKQNMLESLRPNHGKGTREEWRELVEMNQLGL